MTHAQPTPAIEMALMCLGVLPPLQTIEQRARTNDIDESDGRRKMGRQEQILAYIASHGSVTRQAIKFDCHCSEQSLSTALTRLRSKGLITGRRQAKIWFYESTA